MSMTKWDRKRKSWFVVEVKDEENRKWEDWLMGVNHDDDDFGVGRSRFEKSNGSIGIPGNGVGEDSGKLFFGCVKTVPLAAVMLDVSQSQKLEIVKALNLDNARYRVGVEIRKSTPLSDEELYLELRHKVTGDVYGNLYDRLSLSAESCD